MRRSLLATALAALALSLLLGFGRFAAIARAASSFSPVADAYVREAAPSSNYGSSTRLRADGGSDPDVESYLRFSVTGISGTVQSAKLRVYATSGTANGPAVFATGGAWSENAITWANRPGRTSAAADDKGAIAAGTWVEYDVTPLVAGNGDVSFALATSSSDGVDFHSRQASANRPQLVVTVAAGGADTQPPSAPTDLIVKSATANQVDLSWTAATDNVGVTAYEIYRDGALIATVGAVTTYSDAAVAAGITYRYAVKARDAAGNVSSASNTVTVTTPATSTTVLAPIADARVEEANPATNYGASTNLRADGAADPDVESYFRFSLSGLSGTVQAAKLRLYAWSGTGNGPALYGTDANWTEAGITWNARPARAASATEDKAAIGANTWVEYDVTPLVTGGAGGAVSFALIPQSNDGVDFYAKETTTANRPQLVVTVASGPADTTPPSAPANLSATAASASQVNLSWDASTDDVGVTAYEIYRNTALLQTVGNVTSYSDTTAAAATTYSYSVKARDAAGNLSPQSNTASVTTPTAPAPGPLSIGAYFYPWYGAGGHHWNDGYLRRFLSTRQTPRLGEYDSRDPNTIATQLQWAQHYGVDFFISSWWGANGYEDITTRDYLLPSPSIGNTKVTLLYESLALLPRSSGVINFDANVESKLISDFDYLARTYFGHPSYLKINGRPVVYIYVTRIWRGEYARAITSLRATIKSRYGYDLYLVGDEVDWDGSPNGDRIRLFDAITAYTMYSDLQTPGWPDNTGFLAGVRDRYSRFKAVADTYGVRFIPNVLPAFNDRGVRLAANHYALPHEVRPGIDGSYSLFDQFLGVAAEFLDPQLPTMTVTSWNEWHEDTQIEPTASAAPSSTPLEYTQGYTYSAYEFKLLEMLQRFSAAHGG